MTPLEKQLAEALDAVSHGVGPEGRCWCGMAISHPMVKNHTIACRKANRAVIEFDRQLAQEQIGVNY